jgi:cyclopropane-fatty-acyl-phospholipid synthase
VPSTFFDFCLGKYKKYSSCYWDSRTKNLDDAEFNALKISATHADLKDGQTILELGCGWGSLTLFMAQHYPKSRICAVSNSNSQRVFIENEAKKKAEKYSCYYLRHESI